MAEEKGEVDFSAWTTLTVHTPGCLPLEVVWKRMSEGEFAPGRVAISVPGSEWFLCISEQDLDSLINGRLMGPEMAKLIDQLRGEAWEVGENASLGKLGGEGARAGTEGPG